MGAATDTNLVVVHLNTIVKVTSRITAMAGMRCLLLSIQKRKTTSHGSIETGFVTLFILASSVMQSKVIYFIRCRA